MLIIRIKPRVNPLSNWSVCISDGQGHNCAGVGDSDPFEVRWVVIMSRFPLEGTNPCMAGVFRTSWGTWGWIGESHICGGVPLWGKRPGLALTGGRNEVTTGVVRR